MNEFVICALVTLGVVVAIYAIGLLARREIRRAEQKEAEK